MITVSMPSLSGVIVDVVAGTAPLVRALVSMPSLSGVIVDGS